MSVFKKHTPPQTLEDYSRKQLAKLVDDPNNKDMVLIYTDTRTGNTHFATTLTNMFTVRGLFQTMDELACDMIHDNTDDGGKE